MSFFTLQKTSGHARMGQLETQRGPIPTPVFMPVGTRASVKTLICEDLEAMGAPIILGNTYHLYLRPGHELIERQGGLHRFMGWQRAILTDSGGFQVFSLAHMGKKREEGVEFQSHIDGSRHLLGPEKAMAIQRSLGSDIVMMFDDCPALPASGEGLRESMELTLRWAARCAQAPLRAHQHLFGIIQGGLDEQMRQECLERLEQWDLPGLALGGLSVGEKNEQMRAFLRSFVPRMPAAKPRYLMGVGTPVDIVQAVGAGIDMFDCVLPTRNARNGQAFTWRGPINVKKNQWREDDRPLDEHCPCPICQRYSKAYIRHLYMVGEFSAQRMLTYHNVHFYLDLMRQLRQAIAEDRFDEYAKGFYNRYTQSSKTV